jgi:hypothetical protein
LPAGSQLDPELAEAIMAKGMILWSPSRNFQHAEALACLEKALNLQPNLDHAWNRAGTICTHVGRIPEAIAAFGKSRRVNPFNTAHHSVVQAFLWSGDYGRAAAELEVWKSASPESKYVCWYLLQPAVLMGDFVETMAEPMGHDLVGHHALMPGVSKTAQAVVATGRLEDGLHVPMMTTVSFRKTLTPAGSRSRDVRQGANFGSRLIAHRLPMAFPDSGRIMAITDKCEVIPASRFRFRPATMMKSKEVPIMGAIFRMRGAVLSVGPTLGEEWRPVWGSGQLLPRPDPH